MDIKIFIRNVAMYKLNIADLDNTEKNLYTFLVDNLSDLSCFQKKYTYYVNPNSKIIYFYVDINHGRLYVNMELWGFLTYEIMLTKQGINDLITWWLVKPMKLNITYILSSNAISNKSIYDENDNFYN